MYVCRWAQTNTSQLVSSYFIPTKVQFDLRGIWYEMTSSRYKMTSYRYEMTSYRYEMTSCRADIRAYASADVCVYTNTRGSATEVSEAAEVAPDIS